MIRRAEAKDLEGVNRCLRQVLMVHAEGRPDIFKLHTKKYLDDELLEIFQDDEKPVFVSVDEQDEVLGYAFCMLEVQEENHVLHAMKTLYIDDICVDEKYRGQHVATGLYEHVVAYAKTIGCDRITLNVWEVNPTALKFYQAMGMKPLKTMMETKLK